MWAGFSAFILVALAIDLWVMRSNGPHRITQREAVGWSAILIFIGAALIAVAMLASLWIAPRPKRAN